MSHTKRALLKSFNLLYMALIWNPKINLEIQSINGFKTTSRGKKHAFTNRFEIQFGALEKNKSICLFGFIEQTNRFVVAMLCNCVLSHTPPANLLRQCFLFFCFFSWIQMIYQIENYAITTHRIECVMMKQKKYLWPNTTSNYWLWYCM